MPGSVANAAIRAYQRYISPDYNAAREGRCAFSPSCSEYTRERVELDGARGAGEGLLRMWGCGREAHERNAHGALAAGAELQGEGPEGLAGVETLRSLASRLQPLLASGDPRADLVLREEYAQVTRDFDVLRLDRPGTDDRTHERYLVRPRFVPQRHGSEPGPLRRALAAAAGAISGMVGAALGAVLGGATGAVAGVAAGLAARSGALERLEERVSREQGPAALHGLRSKHRLLTAPVAAAGPAGALVALLWGAPAGAALGLASGAAVAGRMGYALGKNATAHLLGTPPPAHPHLPGCACCSPAR